MSDSLLKLMKSIKHASRQAHGGEQPPTRTGDPRQTYLSLFLYTRPRYIAIAACHNIQQQSALMFELHFQDVISLFSTRAPIDCWPLSNSVPLILAYAFIIHVLYCTRFQLKITLSIFDRTDGSAHISSVSPLKWFDLNFTRILYSVNETCPSAAKAVVLVLLKSIQPLPLVRTPITHYFTYDLYNIKAICRIGRWNTVHFDRMPCFATHSTIWNNKWVFFVRARCVAGIYSKFPWTWQILKNFHFCMCFLCMPMETNACVLFFIKFKLNYCVQKCKFRSSSRILQVER